MQYCVLKAFNYSHDGVRIEQLAPGATPHIRDDLVEGLKDAGFIGDLAVTEPDPPREEAPPAPAAAAPEKPPKPSKGPAAPPAAEPPTPGANAGADQNKTGG